MGTWGTGLYSDDLASDVKDLYCDLLTYGWEDADAEQRVIEDSGLKDDIDSTPGWLALAETEWRYGRLSETIRDKALFILDNDIDLKNWEGSRVSDIRSRKRVLSKLRDKLLTEQGRRKKPTATKDLFIPWEYGDVVALKLDENSRHCGKYGLAVVVYKERYKRSVYTPDSFMNTDISISWLSEPIDDINDVEIVEKALSHPAILCFAMDAKEGKPRLSCREDIFTYGLNKKFLDQFKYIGNIREFIKSLTISTKAYSIYESCPTIGFNLADEQHWAFRLPEGIIEYRDVNR